MTVTDIALTTLDGRETSLADYSDRAVLVVNVASKCGLTPQYSALERLAQDYAERGLTAAPAECNRAAPIGFDCGGHQRLEAVDQGACAIDQAIERRTGSGHQDR